MLDAVANQPATVESKRAIAPASQEAILPCVVRGLSYDAGGKRLIDDVDLDLEAGSVTIIMGPNGAGKTVLVRLLHGMLAPARGEIRWAGRPIDEVTRKRQAMVFQTPVLLRRSVVSNIDFVLRLRGSGGRKRSLEVLESAGLAEKADQAARLLSGGERQRLAIARALATDPAILFLDEPTASLDPASVLAIEQSVSAARDRGVKIIFITHDIGQARRLADEVLFMHRGRVVEHSPSSQFFDNPQSNEARDYLAGRIVL